MNNGQILRRQNGKAFITMLGLVICLFGTPTLFAQTGKELVADACYNARQQLEHKTLWSSLVQRRTGGHLYLEKEIETVDGSVRRLLSVDGQEPSPSERKQDDDKLHDLSQNPKAQQALRRDSEADEKKMDDLLRVIPDAFLFEDQGDQEGVERLVFRPNSAYRPKTYEEKALHAMNGFILINLQEKGLTQLSATLMQQVDFGYGAVGRLHKGGTINITRTRVSPGIWKTSSFRIDINGRFLLFKTVGKHRDEVRNDFQTITSDTNIVEALRLLGYTK